MEIGTIIAALDQQIEWLQQARTILLGEPPAKRRGRRRDRPTIQRHSNIGSEEANDVD